MPSYLIFFLLRFGEVPGDFAMDEVDCNGSEKSINDCKHKQVDNCDTDEGAGVECTMGEQGTLLIYDRIIQILLSIWLCVECLNLLIECYM